MALQSPTRAGRIRIIVGWIALIVTLLAAIANGAYSPLAWIALSTIGLVLLAIVMVLDLIDGDMGVNSPHLWLPGLMMGLVLIWCWMQTSVSGTQLVATILEPIAAALGHSDEILVIHPAWTEVEASGMISADPIAGRNSALKLTGFAALFWIAARAATSGQTAVAMMRAIGLFIALVSAFGLFAYASGNNPLISDPAGPLTATFVNRNSFATYAAFGVVINIALLLQVQKGGAESEDRRQALRRFVEAFTSSGWLFTIALLLCATALIASQSRGGAIAVAFGIAVLFALDYARSHRGGRATLALVGLSLVFVLAISASGLFGRLVAAPAEESRFRVYGALVEGIEIRPLLGHGLGAFNDAFRAFVPLAQANAEWGAAHNTYLELAFELGLPATILLCLALILIGLQVAYGALTRQRHSVVPLAGIGCASAAALHSVFDFSLQIPAIAAAFAFIMGLAWVQSFSTRPS